MADEEMFDYDEPIEGAKSNVIDKGRYKFTVLDISQYVSSNGNKCAKIKFELVVEGHKIPMERSIVREGRMKFQWHNFLFAIGIRSKGAGIEIAKSTIVGATGLVDIGVKDRKMDDGKTMEVNKIINFSPIDKAVAPVDGVPPEDAPAQGEPPAPKKEPAKTKEEKKKPEASNVEDL